MEEAAGAIAEDISAGAAGGALSTAQTGETAGSEGVLSSTQQETQTSVDYSKMSNEDYFKDFKAPEGVDVDVESLTKNFGDFLRENKISPDVLSKYLAIEGKLQMDADAAAKAESDKAAKEAADAFKAEGELVRKNFTPEQISSAVSALSEFKDDKGFFELATGQMSNNQTLVKLLVNWAETHKGDSAPGGAAAPGSKQDFASSWMGVKR